MEAFLLALQVAERHTKTLHDQKQLALCLIEWARQESDGYSPDLLTQASRYVFKLRHDKP